jgi:hypothetical protein
VRSAPAVVSTETGGAGHLGGISRVHAHDEGPGRLDDVAEGHGQDGDQHVLPAERVHQREQRLTMSGEGGGGEEGGWRWVLGVGWWGRWVVGGGAGACLNEWGQICHL